MLRRRDMLTVGLAQGKHMTESISAILGAAGIPVPEYADPRSRLFQARGRLPSGRELGFVLDKSNDLCHQLARGIVDVAITGMDYVQNLQLASNFSLGPQLPWSSRVQQIELAHARLRHLGFYGTQFAAMIRSPDRHYSSLDEVIDEREEVVCFTEFPAIAAVRLMGTPSYRRRFGARRPLLVFRGASFGENPAVVIVRSEGSTESKAVAKPGDLIVELMLSARTAELNELQVIERFGEKIYTAAFKCALRPELEPHVDEFIRCIEHVVEQAPDQYQVQLSAPQRRSSWREATG